MIHANLRYKTLGYLVTVLKSSRRVMTEEVKSEHIPVEQKRHKKHENDHWSLLFLCSNLNQSVLHWRLTVPALAVSLKLDGAFHVHVTNITMKNSSFFIKSKQLFGAMRYWILGWCGTGQKLLN